MLAYLVVQNKCSWPCRFRHPLEHLFLRHLGSILGGLCWLILRYVGLSGFWFIFSIKFCWILYGCLVDFDWIFTAQFLLPVRLPVYDRRFGFHSAFLWILALLKATRQQPEARRRTKIGHARNKKRASRSIFHRFMLRVFLGIFRVI